MKRPLLTFPCFICLVVLCACELVAIEFHREFFKLLYRLRRSQSMSGLYLMQIKCVRLFVLCNVMTSLIPSTTCANNNLLVVTCPFSQPTKVVRHRVAHLLFSSESTDEDETKEV
jgi:hypothetical protein